MLRSAWNRSRKPALLLASAFVFAAPAVAEEFKLGEDPVSVIMRWRPTTPDPEVKDFVRASRPDARDLEYKPLSGPKVDRPKLKSKEELRAMVKGLDGQAEGLRLKGAAASGRNEGRATALQLQAAGAESRRRAAQDFAGAGAAPSAATSPAPAK